MVNRQLLFLSLALLSLLLAGTLVWAEDTTTAASSGKVNVKILKPVNAAKVNDDFRKLNQDVMTRRRLAADNPLRVLADTRPAFEAARELYKNAKTPTEKTAQRDKLVAQATIRIKAYRAQLENLTARLVAYG